MTITVGQIGWSKYRQYEGPWYRGFIKVPLANRTDPFDMRVLSLTTSAEGGCMDSLNMYDGGLVSLGAIQFIDANSFQVTDLLGAVAEELGLDYVLDVMKPALDISNASFGKTKDGKWRFFINGAVVNSLFQQKVLYLGDSQGNIAGSFYDAKKLRAKTWAACLVNIWQEPVACQVQTRFTLPKLLSNFVWGDLKTDLFTGEQQEDGWLGATRALLLSFAVNSPANVVKRYAAVRNNKHEKYSAKWCLAVLRGVVIGGGIDVWPTRWEANRNLTERLFGVTIPTYKELSLGVWPEPSEPTKTTTVEQFVEEVTMPTGYVDVKDVEVSNSLIAIEKQPRESIFQLIMNFIKIILSVISGGKK